MRKKRENINKIILNSDKSKLKMNKTRSKSMKLWVDYRDLYRLFNQLS